MFTIFSDVEQKLKKKNKILFSRDSECLQELKILIEQQKHRTLVTYYYQHLIYWQENIDKVDFEWASFLINDNRPNKEKLLNEKKRI